MALIWEMKVMANMQKINYLTKRVIGAAMEVHSLLGPGYLESAYEQALAIELQSRKIPFERQKVFNLDYKGECIGEGRMDFYVDYILVVELKAVDTLLPVHAAQVISYLKAMDREVGLLLNFHTETFKKGIRRILNPDYREEIINKEK